MGSYPGYVHRLGKGYYDVDLSHYQLKVCPNTNCPKPWRTYVLVKACPFCETSLTKAEG